MPNTTGLFHDEEAIVAHASGHGSAAIAILRLSGKNCHELLLPCLTRKNSKKPWAMNFMTLCGFIDPRTGHEIDEVMVALFRAPYSYTGQDSAEIYFHGSPYILQTAFQILYSLGVRHAEPGEFTRRAFLAGKMDLSAAEGIHELIAASSEQQWLAARHLYTGQLKDLVEQLHGQLKEATAWLEASIDFPEEDDTSQISRQHVLKRAEKVRTSLKQLLASYQGGQVARQGLGLAIIGEPNAGKSTLMNTLLNTERAIVSDIAGTTRDYLEESCLINGRLVRLIDTAGIRKGAETVEQMGIAKAFALAKSADLVLFLIESPVHKDALQKVEEWIHELEPRHYLKVYTKADLVQDLPTDGIAISCHSGLGLDQLKSEIEKLSNQALAPLKEHAFISSVRHKDAVENALKSLDAFFAAHNDGAYDEILAFELQQAAKQLVSIIGVVSTEEILDLVFSSFCVGK